MAENVVTKIELESGSQFSFADQTARDVADDAAQKVGTLDDLDTDSKHDLVDAINEVNESARLIQNSPRLPSGSWETMFSPNDETIDEWNESASDFWEYLDNMENGYYRVILWQDVFGESGNGFGTMIFANQGSVAAPSGDYGEAVMSFSVGRVSNIAIDWWLHISGKSGNTAQSHSMYGRVIGGQLVDWRLDGRNLSESGTGSLEVEVSLQKIE